MSADIIKFCSCSVLRLYAVSIFTPVGDIESAYAGIAANSAAAVKTAQNYDLLITLPPFVNKFCENIVSQTAENSNSINQFVNWLLYSVL